MSTKVNQIVHRHTHGHVVNAIDYSFASNAKHGHLHGHCVYAVSNANPKPKWKTKGDKLTRTLEDNSHCIKSDGVSDDVNDGVK
jgi:hypothetical protein